MKKSPKSSKLKRIVVLGEGHLWTDGTRYRVELHQNCTGDCNNDLIPMYPSIAHGKLVRLVAELID